MLLDQDSYNPAEEISTRITRTLRLQQDIQLRRPNGGGARFGTTESGLGEFKLQEGEETQ